MKTIELPKLPPSVLTKKQVRKERADYLDERGRECVIIAEIRYDDECGNGHNSFAITADIFTPDRYPGERTCQSKSNRTLWQSGGGCCHKEVAKYFPKLAPFIKWHLTSSDGPMHYVANTVYHAGDRDCHGLKKGEFRQHTSRGQQNNGIAGVPNWELNFPEGFKRDVYAATKPEPVTLEWQPSGRTGEGKERDLSAARHCAVWLDATDEELTAPGLETRLITRLPALMAEFKTAIEALGFVY